MVFTQPTGQFCCQNIHLDLDLGYVAGRGSYLDQSNAKYVCQYL